MQTLLILPLRTVRIDSWKYSPAKVKLRCKDCMKTYPRRSLLLYHYHKNHSRRTTFSCPDCNKTFDKDGINQFLYHIDCHDSLRCHTCHGLLSDGNHFCSPWFCGAEGCGQVFPKRSLLTQHYQYHHLKLHPFVCPDCRYRTTDFEDFIEHVDEHEDFTLCDACTHQTDTYEHIVQCSNIEMTY